LSGGKGKVCLGLLGFWGMDAPVSLGQTDGQSLSR